MYTFGLVVWFGFIIIFRRFVLCIVYLVYLKQKILYFIKEDDMERKKFNKIKEYSVACRIQYVVFNIFVFPFPTENKKKIILSFMSHAN